MALTEQQILDVRVNCGLYAGQATWLEDEEIQVLARRQGYIVGGAFDEAYFNDLSIAVLERVLAKGVLGERADAMRSLIPELRREGLGVARRNGGSRPAPTPGSLTYDEVRDLLVAAKLWAPLADFDQLVAVVAAIRSLPDHSGHAAGEVLTILATGGVDWATIGEAQIAAAVAQYLVDNPIDGVTSDQLTAALRLRIQAEQALGTRIDNLTMTVSDNKTAIAQVVAGLSTERGRINALDDLVRANRGSIGIAPNAIPRVAAAQRDYTMSYEDLDDAWLRGKSVNEMEVWLKNTAFHAIDPWAPTADGTFTVNINETEARAIALSGADRIVPVRLVWRANGQFVALRNTWLELMPAAGVSELAEELKAEVTARTSGDELQPETITGAAGFVSFLADQEMSAETSIAHFTIAVSENYKGVRHTYKAGDLAWFAPGSVDGKVFANIAPPDAPELPTADKIEMLNLRADPGVIAYPSGGLTAALTRTVTILLDNPARLDTANLFYQGSVDGQAVLTRRAWTTAVNSVPLVIPANTAALVGQDEELTLEIQWYDDTVANNGKLVGLRRVDIPLVKQTAVAKLANRAAYNALAAKDSMTLYYVAKA